MDKLSKDIILKMCGTMIMKDVLNMRCLTKRYDRIISGYVDKNFYLNFKDLDAWMTNRCRQIIFSDENDTDKIKIINKIKNRISLVEKIHIDTDVNDMEYICKSCKSIKNIIISKKQEKYDFLSLLQSLESIEINFALKSQVEIFPMLENVRYLTINVFGLKISDVLKKLPNIEKLICDNIILDVKTIPKIKYLEITCSYKIIIDDHTEIIMEDLEEIILHYTDFKKILTIPHAKKITINEINSNNVRHCLSIINFDNNKVEYLAIKNNIHREAFVSLYGSLEFKSLKKIDFGNKYKLLNNKIIEVN